MSGTCRGCKPIFYASMRNARTLDSNRSLDRTVSETDVSAAAIREAGADTTACLICADLWEGITAFAGGRAVTGYMKMELWKWRSGQQSLFFEFHAGSDNVSIEFYTPAGNIKFPLVKSCV